MNNAVNLQSVLENIYISSAGKGTASIYIYIYTTIYGIYIYIPYIVVYTPYRHVPSQKSTEYYPTTSRTRKQFLAIPFSLSQFDINVQINFLTMTAILLLEWFLSEVSCGNCTFSSFVIISPVTLRCGVVVIKGSFLGAHRIAFLHSGRRVRRTLMDSCPKESTFL